MIDRRVVVRGGGDLGSGVALRLWRAGFSVAIVEKPHPMAVRRTVSFSEAIYDGMAHVEEARAHRLAPGELFRGPAACDIGIAVDPDLEGLRMSGAYALVDATLAKRDSGVVLHLAEVVIGLGPGFVAGSTVHAVVETNRGPDLGRVIWAGAAQANTGIPGSIDGHDLDRVLRAPAAGTLRNERTIGDIVEQGDIIAWVDAEPIRANFRSLVRGLARDGLDVEKGTKVGDTDPRLDPSLCRRVSDKSLSVAGGVLEAILLTIKKES